MGLLVGSSRSFLEEARQESGAGQSRRSWPAVDQSLREDRERERERTEVGANVSRCEGFCVVRRSLPRVGAEGMKEGEEVAFSPL